MPGLDGAKMSKSYDNTIEIFEEEKALRKKIMGIKTDSTSRRRAETGGGLRDPRPLQARGQ